MKVDLANPMPIAESEIRSRLRQEESRYATVREYASPDRPVLDLQLPTAEELFQRVPLMDLETPWESPLEGSRIANFNGTGLRILERRNGNVTWSRRLYPNKADLIYGRFLQTISESIQTLLLYGLWSGGGELTYDLELCARLLRESFKEPKKPRLVPRITWPTEERRLELVKEAIPTIPWKFEDYSGSLALDVSEKGQYSFISRGERGDINFAKTSHDVREVYLAAFDCMTRRLECEDDKNFVYDWVYFSDEELGSDV